jgi:hypothetical protein
MFPFSNITDAWNHDPVKEMTDKLSKGAFRTNTDQSEIFNLKNQSNNINQNRVNQNKVNQNKVNQNKVTNIVPKSKDFLSLSDGNSLSLLSENTLGTNTIESDFGSFAPVNFDKYTTKKKYQSKKKHNKYYDNANDDSDLSSDLSSDFAQNSRCNYSVKHLKKCDRCYDKLKKLVNTKVNQKFDEMILDTKMKQLQNASIPPTHIIHPQMQPQIQPLMQQQIQPQMQPANLHPQKSDSWKELLIIVVGAIIAIFIVFLIVKALNK